MDQLPVAIPGCQPWREANGPPGDPATLCPSVWCERCQTIRALRGEPQLVPFTVPLADRLHPAHQEGLNRDA